MNAMIALFLGVLAVFILGGARVALWIYDQRQQPDQRAADTLADADARRANDWSRDEWWR